ncbi:MAG: hypothetical protein LZF60_80256 [Nitrospira sp.]|nr:MAG: hypothetical protein LZF60_80256 [Nitrospira sp.]
MNGSLRLRKPDAHEVQHTTALGTGGIRIVNLSVSIRHTAPPEIYGSSSMSPRRASAGMNQGRLLKS